MLKVNKSMNGKENKPTKLTNTLSILSNDMSIEGNIIAQSDIQIEGSINGNIIGKSVTIGTSAKIKGDIRAEEVNINGYIEGNIFAHLVKLTSTSHIDGNIYHTHIMIEKGASIRGFFEKTETPLKEQKEISNEDIISNLSDKKHKESENSPKKDGKHLHAIKKNEAIF